MSFTFPGHVLMFYCYVISIYNENCHVKEKALGFQVDCLLYVVLSGALGLCFFVFSSFVKIYIGL